MTHTRKAQIDSLLPTAPSVKVDTCGIRTADPCPLARTLPPLGRWSGSFSHGVSFLGRETKDQPFNSYRCHPQGVFTGPYLLRRPYHPQKPASQTLRLQGAPPTPAYIKEITVGKNHPPQRCTIHLGWRGAIKWIQQKSLHSYGKPVGRG